MDAMVRSLERLAAQGDEDAIRALVAWHVRRGWQDPPLQARVIYADPPWRYQNFSEKKHGAAASNYTTMSTEDICALPVGRYATDDAFLVMWGTWPKLPDGILVMESWGFEYVTACPWIKTLPDKGDIYTGIGFWFQSCSEVLMIGKRRKTKADRLPTFGLLTGERESPVFYAPKSRKHSVKPVEIHQWIEAKSPGPYLEVFATRERPGWTCWGLALGHLLTPDGLVPVEPVAHK